MALSLQECIDKIKKEYPNHYPHAYVETEGKYAFNLVPKGQNVHGAIADMHIVDPETGYVSGGLSIMEFLKDPTFRAAWKHPNLVAHHDESLGHSSDFRSAKERGWGVRKIQNGRTAEKSRPFSVNENDLVYGGSLSHHGIKGQHWGTRNGPPYPLDQKTHNRVVKNASKTEGKSEGEVKTGLIPELIGLASYIAIQAYLMSPSHVRKQQEKRQRRHNEHNRNVSKDLLSDIADVDKTFSENDMPRQIEGPHSIEDDLRDCNPRYNDGVVPGTTNNCTLCAYTYDMRRRGYDVTALASELGNLPVTLSNHLYKNAKEDKIKAGSFTEMFEKAEKMYPEGARGEVHLCQTAFGSGHSMAWEIRNGKLEILDPQRNEKYDAKILKEYNFNPNDSQNGFIRTDNLEVNPEGINLVSAEYKPGWRDKIASEKEKKQEKTESKSSDKKEVAAVSVNKEPKRTEKPQKTEQKDATPSNGRYANKKMSSKQAIKTAYDDLEKKYPNFNEMPLEKQDKLFFDYINESGLDKWI